MSSSLPVLYRDPDLLVVDKPSGLLVHRGWGSDPDTALRRARALAGAHVYPVHRLDRGTSGALAFALSPSVARAFETLFEEHRVLKRYLALVRGVPPAEGTIDHPVPKDEQGPRVPARTEFRRLATAEPIPLPDGHVLRVSLVEATPLTGRLHQVRRHMKHLGHPLIGDANYGRGDLNRLLAARVGLRRLALHAGSLAFPHPVTGAPIAVTCPVPADLAAPLGLLGLPV